MATPFDMAADLMGQAGNQFQSAADGTGANSPRHYTEEVLGSMNQFVNPYYQDVISSTLGRMDDARRGTINRTGDAATAAGAFGGARHGLMEAQVNQDYLQDVQGYTADMNRQSFMDRYNMAIGSMGQGMQHNAQRSQGARDMAGLAGSYYGIGNDLNDRNAAQGQQQQDLLQQILSGGADQFNQFANSPYQMIDFINAAISGNPLTGAVTQTGTSTSTPGLFDWVSMAAQGAGSAMSGGLWNPFPT